MTSTRTFLSTTLTAAALVTASMLGSSTAAATDMGGDGNPYVSCPNAYTVASAPIVSNGRTVGLVELRWSYACSGNWTRTTSYIGAINPLTSQVFTEGGEPVKSAWATDHATQNSSPFIRVAPSRRVCAVGVLGEVGTGSPVAHVCSN